MIDLSVDQQPNSHYEYIIESKSISSQILAKQQALRAMKVFGGWCSEAKASILMDLIFMFKPKVIVEIGVWTGGSFGPMAFALKENGTGKIYGIDPWSKEASVKGMDKVNADWWGKTNHEKVYKKLVKDLNKMELTPYVELIRKTSEEAPIIKGIDFLHIDGNHSEQASYLDVTKWSSQVNPGGIIILDDLTWTTAGKSQLTRAVAYLDKTCTKLAEFKGPSAWGIWIKN